MVNEPITVERGKKGLILLKLTVPFVCDYDKETKRVMPCSLNVEFKTQQRSKCGGITSNSLCGTSFRNDKWNEVKSLSVQHINEFSYKISSVHRVKLSTLPLLSHPIWSNIELPVLQVLLVIFSKRIVLLDSNAQAVMVIFFSRILMI